MDVYSSARPMTGGKRAGTHAHVVQGYPNVPHMMRTLQTVPMLARKRGVSHLSTGLFFMVLLLFVFA